LLRTAALPAQGDPMQSDQQPHSSAAAVAPVADPRTLDSGDVAIRGGAIRVVGYVGGVLVSLAAAAILVRHLGISQFGRYATVTSLIAIVGGVTEAGISLYGIREFQARSDRDRRELMASLLGMRLALTLIGIALATCFALLAGYSDVLVLGALVVGAGLLVQVVADVLSVPLQAQLRLATLTLVDLNRRIVALALIGALALAGAGLIPLFAVPIGSGLAALLLLVWLVRDSLALTVNFGWRSWRGLVAQTLPSAVATSIGVVYFYVTIIVMSLIASATQTGLFATSFRVTQVALGIPILLLTAIFPVMSREDSQGRSEAGQIVGRVFTVAVICGVWMSLAMALGASFVLDVVAGKQGHAAVPVLRIQALVLTLSFISASSALTLISLRRFRPMILVSSSGLLLNVVLGLALVPSLGARGGALADVLTEAVVAAALTTIVVREGPRRRIGFSLAAPLALATALAGAVVLLPIGAVAHVAAATIVYFGVLVLTGSIPVELTRAARGIRALRGAG
jgi:O-antigen/teichoic acid export membrane protein